MKRSHFFLGVALALSALSILGFCGIYFSHNAAIVAACLANFNFGRYLEITR
ncbi:MAG TPA: hypothetical protein VGI10_10095 [Polyangiaceae bacterium]|jgi:hypothetical protein